MKLVFISALFLLATVVTNCKGNKPKPRIVSFGILKIFNHFINVTDPVSLMPPVMHKIANDLLNDVRRLIPEVEKTLAKYNITEEALHEMGGMLNVTRLNHELMPELEKAFNSMNMSHIVKEIRSYMDMSLIRSQALPELDKFVKENNVSQVFDEIRTILNVTFIADQLLPEIERMLEGENITAIAKEVEVFLNLNDISGKLVPAMEGIFESNNISQVIHEIDRLLDLTHLAEQILPELGKLFEEIKINETIAEIRKFLDMSHVNGLLDELQKLIDDNNITQHVPDLAPFLDLNILRSKLGEVGKIIVHYDIPEILDEVERLTNVSYLIHKVPELDEFLESLGFTSLLTDMKHLLEMSFVKDTWTDIKNFLLSADMADKINDLEKLMNTTYIRARIVPELERMLRGSNLTGLIDEVEQFLNTTYLEKEIVPQLEKMFEDHDIIEQMNMMLDFLNTTFLEKMMEQLDKEYNISKKGEQISNGDLAGVVNGVIDQIFQKQEENVRKPDPSNRPPPKSTKTPIVCIDDCHGVPCGTAIMNACKMCVKGTTGRLTNHGMDCNNVCNGRARTDVCGACTNPPATDRTGKDSPFMDCHGTCFGTSAYDSCGDCTEGKTGKQADYRKDACGLCGGDNSSCAGCDGVPNSGKVNDSCKVCGGDGSTCTTISSVVPSLLPMSSDSLREVLVHGAGLDGQAIKCFFNGTKSAGTVVDKTHCKCTIPNGQVAGSKGFTVKVVKNGADVDTANLQIELYHQINTKITSLVPAELFTTEVPTVTFSGSGLIQIPSAVCMVEGAKIPAVYNGGTYQCTMTPMPHSKQITIDLSLNGVHKLASDVNRFRTVFARAPVLAKAKFSDTGALITVGFSKDVSTSSLEACSDIFDSATMSALTQASLCHWSDRRHLVVTPASSSTILPSARLALKANAIACADELFSKHSSGSVAIDAPTKPAQPVPVINGPLQISSCGDLTLDGSKSRGGGGRLLQYTWTLVGQTNSGITTVLDAARNKPKVLISGTLMRAGQSYTFSLGVKNFLSATVVTKTITVAKATNPLPEVTLADSVGGKGFAGKGFFINAKAKAASCSSDKTLTFAWTVSCSNEAAKIQAERSAGFKLTSSKAALKIDANSLVGGETYVFTLVVALKASPTTKTTVRKTLTVEWSALEPAIAGGDRTVGLDTGSITFDAKSSTVDPDSVDGELSCTWSCTVKSSGQPCYTKKTKLALLNQCVLKVPSSYFQVQMYQITAQVSKGSRTGSASIILTVVAGSPPVVGVLTPNLKVGLRKPVKLFAGYRSSVQPTKTGWRCVTDEDHRFVNLSDSSIILSYNEKFVANKRSYVALVIKPNVLSPGASYKFIIDVDAGGSIGSATMIVRVPSGPFAGEFEVSATTLQALQTVKLTAPLWVTDEDAYPLKYTFGYVDKSGAFKRLVTQTSNEYIVRVPPGFGLQNVLKLKLCVTDAFLAVSCKEKNITVNPVTSFNQTEIENSLADRLKEAKDNGDPLDAVSEFRVYYQATKGNANAPTGLGKKIAEHMLDALDSGVDAAVLDGEKALGVVQAYTDVDTGYIEQAKTVLGGFKKVVEASVRNMGKETVEETLTWMTGFVSKVDLSDGVVLKDLRDVDLSLAKSLAKQVEFGQPAVETAADNPRVVIKVLNTIPDGLIQANSGSDPTAVNFGAEIAEKCGDRECAPGIQCLGCQLKFLSYKQDLISGNLTTTSNVVSDKIISVDIQSAETGEDMAVSGLTTPIEISIELGSESSGKEYDGKYFDEDKEEWVKGNTTSKMEGTKLIMSTPHLTSFAPDEQTSIPGEAEDDDNTALIIGIVVGVTLGVILIALIVAYVVHNKKKESKVRSVTPPVNHYDNYGQSQHVLTPV